MNVSTMNKRAQNEHLNNVKFGMVSIEFLNAFSQFSHVFVTFSFSKFEWQTKCVKRTKVQKKHNYCALCQTQQTSVFIAAVSAFANTKIQIQITIQFSSRPFLSPLFDLLIYTPLSGISDPFLFLLASFVLCLSELLV